MKKVAIFLIICFFRLGSIFADGALGTWNAYMAYRNVTAIAPVGNTIYALSSGDLFNYNTTDQTVTLFDKANNLSDSEISLIAYSSTYKVLIVVYSNSNIDLIDDDDDVTNLSDIYAKSTTEDKTVNSIMTSGNYAYLSTNLGIIILNLKKQEKNLM